MGKDVRVCGEETMVAAMSAALGWLGAFMQMNDALFPTGAYAHSLGFEECVRLGLVEDEAGLAAYLRDQVLPPLQNLELPYLRYAYKAWTAGDWTEIEALELEISAWKVAAETREASRQLGRRRLHSLRTISKAETLAEYEAKVERGELAGHHLVVFAGQAVLDGAPLEAALAAWYYQAMAAVCSAALKLVRIGQEGMQRALREAVALLNEAIAHSLKVARADAGCFSPMLEIASMRHARAGERLFIS